MYKLKEEARNWEPIPEVPWRDLTDDEYEAVSAHYDVQFPDQPGSLKRWFQHVPDKPAAKKEE